ncbi:MAG: OFA family MFS transporter [Thermostichales cyanobacterium HHBFW_bins_127]
MKVFGLPPQQGRWLLIPVGILVLLCLGTVYSWSLFRKPLEAELGIGATASLLPYTIAFMPIAGRWIPRWGPRRVTALGGLAVGLGYCLASLADQIGTLILSYGVIAGTGVGITYGVPMAVMARWFPERRGLAVGLTVIGFGLSPLITAPLAAYGLRHVGPRLTLGILGVVFTLLILSCAWVLRFPPSEWGSQPTQPLARQVPLWQQRRFYGLWGAYALGTLVGLSAIGISAPVGEEVIGLDPGLAARCVSLFAVFNGLSRPLFGWLSDRWPPERVAGLSYGLMLVASLLMLTAGLGDLLPYGVAFALFWFCLGGWLAMAPALTLRLFDPAHYAQNYGLVFTAYGVGALLGTAVTGWLRDGLGSYTYGFYGFAILALLGATWAQYFLGSRD